MTKIPSDQVKNAVDLLGQAKSVDELQQVWAANVKEWMKLGPIEIRLIITTKDSRKLDLAMDSIESDSEESKRLANEVIMSMFSENKMLKPAWKELSESGLSGDDVPDYREASFLYALEKLRVADASYVQHVYEQNERTWRKLIPSEGMAILTKTYLDIVRPATISAFQGSRSGR